MSVLLECVGLTKRYGAAVALDNVSFTLESGNGILCSGGTVRNIQWTRTENGLTFTENGKDATFLTGKTYICVVSDGYKDGTVIG